MRFAYADPPYVGQAKRHYGPDAEEVDHVDLVKRLVSDFDGWALSLHVTSLRDILPLTPPGTRVLAWVKPWASFKPGTHPHYAWEPVLLSPCRNPKRTDGGPACRDWISLNAWGVTQAEREEKPIVKGIKREAFSLWLFDCAGLLPDDEFSDLYPGSGAVGAAWETFCGRAPRVSMPLFDGLDVTPKKRKRKRTA